MTDLLDPWELVARRFEQGDLTKDAVAWVKLRGETSWSMQDAIMRSVVENRMTAVPSCHGVGKSHIASRIAAWWVDTHSDEPDEVFLVTTAPTASQVAVVLWRYISQIHRKAELPGRINRSPYPHWVLANDIVGYGRKPADYEESAFQGIHAKHPLILVDEAAGILPGLWDQLFSLASNLNGRILAIGNPTDPTSHFARICEPGSDWTVIQIDALRTPNMSEQNTRAYPLTRLLMEAEGIPFSTEAVDQDVADKLISPQYVEERIRAYCGFTKDDHQFDTDEQRDELKRQLLTRTNASPMFLARIRGVFPTSASEGVVPLAWAQLAVNRWRDWIDAGRPEAPGRRVLGVDVAYYGEDDTVIAIRQGQITEQLLIRTKQDTVETATDVLPWLDWPQALAVVDSNGVGAGTYDLLNRWHLGGKCKGVAMPFVAQARTDRRSRTGEFRFQNTRSAAWWRIRELLDPSAGALLALPDDEDLLAELTSPRYKVLTGAVIAVESKDDIKRRLHRSTDKADAVIQAYWIDGVPVDAPDSDGVPLAVRDGVVQYEGYSPFAFDDVWGGELTAPATGGWDL